MKTVQKLCKMGTPYIVHSMGQWESLQYSQLYSTARSSGLGP